MRKLIFYGITFILFVCLLLWHFSVSITIREGEILQDGDEGEVYVFEDSNPAMDFKIVYEGPLETRELSVESGGHAIVLYNAERKELYLYSHPHQMTLAVDGKRIKDDKAPQVSVWNLMFSKNAFFKVGRHSLTLVKR
jgi:hypothetical protein